MEFYKGKKALVVGGSAGIGLEVAREILRRGGSVCIAARGEQRLNEAVTSRKSLDVTAVSGCDHCNLEFHRRGDDECVHRMLRR